MLFEVEIAELALTNLQAHTGIQGQWLAQEVPIDQGVDGEVLLNIQGNELKFKAEVKREFRRYHMDQLLDQARRHHPLLLIAERIFPAQKEQLREHQISYLDTSGNTYVRNGDVLLWIDGQKGGYNGLETPKTNRAFTKAGLKVVYALLDNETAVNYTYRELASLAGVAIGTINEAMTALKEAGYLLRVNKNRLVLNKKNSFWNNGWGVMATCLNRPYYWETIRCRLITGKKQLFQQGRYGVVSLRAILLQDFCIQSYGRFTSVKVKGKWQRLSD